MPRSIRSTDRMTESSASAELIDTLSRPSIIHSREQWGGKLDFLLSVVGYAVGLANVWRFPYLAYTNGGGAFFIPYFLMVAFVGIPIALLELTLGQFSSGGPTSCWDFCMLFQGCGVAMCIVSGLTSVYYNIIISWAFFFLFASFSKDVPWRKCGDWSTPHCHDRVRYLTPVECQDLNATVYQNGTCVSPSDPEAIWIWNRTLAKKNKVAVTFAALEYFERRATGSAFGSISNIGSVRLDLFGCLVLSWIIVAMCLAKGIKTSGKVVYFTATMPYVILFALFFQGINLDGSMNGIEYYITPQIKALKSAKIWKDAAVQVFFSSASSYGGLIALSSYNKFHNDVLRDSVIVSIADCLTSIFAGFVIFSFLGFLAKEIDIGVEAVATQGPSLAFGVLSYSLTLMKYTQFWSVTFFFMLLLLGLDSQIVLTETVITGLIDIRPNLRRCKLTTVSFICFIMFLMGIPMTTNGGLDILELLDTYAGGWNVLFICVCECIAVGWLYGPGRFLKDINVMLGNRSCGCIPFGRPCRLWWVLCWKFVTPLFSALIILYSWIDYQRIAKFPWWADSFGWAITFSGICSIFGFGCYNVYTAPGVGREKLRYAIKPNKFWGPALVQHRYLVACYVDNFVLNPDAPEPLATKEKTESVFSPRMEEQPPFRTVSDTSGTAEVDPRSKHYTWKDQLSRTMMSQSQTQY